MNLRRLIKIVGSVDQLGILIKSVVKIVSLNFQGFRPLLVTELKI